MTSVAGSLLVLLVLQPLFPLESLCNSLFGADLPNIRAQLEDFAAAAPRQHPPGWTLSWKHFDSPAPCKPVNTFSPLLDDPGRTTLLSFGKRMRSHPEA